MVIKVILQILVPLLTYIATPELASEARLFLSLFSGVIFGWLFLSTPLHITGLIGVSLTSLLGIETATNAIIYGTEKVSKNEMAKFGFVLNMIMAILLPLTLWVLNS